MINTFIHELEKQIHSNQVLYNRTHVEIFKERAEKLKSLMSEVMSQYITSNNEEFIFLSLNLGELRNKKDHIP